MAQAVPLTEFPVQAIQGNRQLGLQALGNESRERMQGREIRAQGMQDLLRSSDRWAGIGMEMLGRSQDREFTALRDEKQREYGMKELAERYKLGEASREADVDREARRVTERLWATQNFQDQQEFGADSDTLDAEAESIYPDLSPRESRIAHREVLRFNNAQKRQQQEMELALQAATWQQKQDLAKLDEADQAIDADPNLRIDPESRQYYHSQIQAKRLNAIAGIKNTSPMRQRPEVPQPTFTTSPGGAEIMVSPDGKPTELRGAGAGAARSGASRSGAPKLSDLSADDPLGVANYVLGEFKWDSIPATRELPDGTIVPNENYGPAVDAALNARLGSVWKVVTEASAAKAGMEAEAQRQAMLQKQTADQQGRVVESWQGVPYVFPGLTRSTETPPAVLPPSKRPAWMGRPEGSGPASAAGALGRVLDRPGDLINRIADAGRGSASPQKPGVIPPAQAAREIQSMIAEFTKAGISPELLKKKDPAKYERYMALKKAAGLE